MAWRAKRRLSGPAAFRALSPALLAAATARASEPNRRCSTSNAPIITNASVLRKEGGGGGGGEGAGQLSIFGGAVDPLLDKEHWRRRRGRALFSYFIIGEEFWSQT